MSINKYGSNDKQWRKWCKNLLKELGEERKMIVKEIYKLRDEVFRECDKVSAKKSIV